MANWETTSDDETRDQAPPVEEPAEVYVPIGGQRYLRFDGEFHDPIPPGMEPTEEDLALFNRVQHEMAFHRNRGAFRNYHDHLRYLATNGTRFNERMLQPQEDFFTTLRELSRYRERHPGMLTRWRHPGWKRISVLHEKNERVMQDESWRCHNELRRAKVTLKKFEAEHRQYLE
jgi:hypothetical protein